jgi:hypothetical protein
MREDDMITLVHRNELVANNQFNLSFTAKVKFSHHSLMNILLFLLATLENFWVWYGW